ncbi:DUF982 domain-containing protein [Rhizobium sp. CC-YZS058]|uniref:DUF982 domain-containing protein n=1 Tax=Rhizobium sp. CC-YZS058 TaxID=3042153 RepID=UPI002B05AB65|nr:DUF982 domain-containing protein [Rhizobium sp. CC-YZS058]MEA3536448.1 DUF982 domain-containing protein [Rhizobium sp. CC-YZS058]
MMIDVRDDVTDICWGDSVVVDLGDGLWQRVRSPAQALQLLTVQWSGEQGERFHKVCDTCYAALARRATVFQARQAFVDFYRTAWSVSR